MPAVLQLRRGTAAVRATVTPADGELFVDTDSEQLYVGDGSTAGGLPVVGAYASVQATPGNPTGTTSTTQVMMGLTTGITPTATGKVLITICGTIFNPTGIADGAIVQIRHGTGGTPANGDAATGTAVGPAQRYVTATTSEQAPFSVTALVTGLSLNVAHWLDAGLAAITAGTATITGVSISAVELP